MDTLKPKVIRIKEDQIMEDHGKTMRLIETVKVDFGEKSGTATCKVFMQPDITLDEWIERAKPEIDRVVRTWGYRLVNEVKS